MKKNNPTIDATQTGRSELAMPGEMCERPAMPFARHLTGILAIALLVAFNAGAASKKNNKSSKTSKNSGRPEAAAPVGPDFAVFKAIDERNIFNANRYGGPRREEAPRPKVTQVDSFALVGTMNFETGQVAFFEGSSSNYRKAHKLNESIGGHKITAIESDCVKLDNEGKESALQIGQQLRREDQGEWKLASYEAPPDYSSSYSSSSSSYGSGSSFGSGFSRDGRSDSRYGSSSGSSRDSRYGSSSGSSRDSRYGSNTGNSRDSRSSSSFGNNDTPADMAQRRIREQDRNGDGKISLAEADSRLRDRFREIDKNGDGEIDAEEYTAYYVARSGGNSSNSGGSSGFGNNSVGSNSSGGSSTGFTTSPGSGGNESDILKRLMQQREQENKK